MVLRPKNATLVVIGDIGRSPRMCFHAKSLADKNYRVQIVGYNESTIHSAIGEHPFISVVPLWIPPDWIGKMQPVIGLIFKFFWTLSVLVLTLFFRINWPLLILVQNPPGIPSLLACWLCARLKCAQFIIDWHNYTYSVLRKKYGVDEIHVERCVKQSALNVDENTSIGVDSRNRRLTRVERAAQAAATMADKEKHQADRKKKASLMQKYVECTYYWEGFFGRRADLNICVSHAMRQDMRNAWGISAATVYDRPPDWSFRILDAEERHKFFHRLAQSDTFKLFAAAEPSHDTNEATRFSFRDEEGVVHLKNDRPLILVSSTSWTEDEDFGLLLSALREFDSVSRLISKTNACSRLPTILCVITGRGPLKSYYMGRIEHMQLQNVEIIAPWLEAEDYPLLLGSADLGVCLHVSTSGFDLPMKVVDMFGCGLPVIAKRFPCIGELVNDGHNGRLFDNSHELSQIIKSLCCGFPDYSTQLNTMASNIKIDSLVSWSHNWDACMWPLIANYGELSSQDKARQQRFSVIHQEDISGHTSEAADLVKETKFTQQPTLISNPEDENVDIDKKSPVEITVVKEYIEQTSLQEDSSGDNSVDLMPEQ